MEVAIYKRLAPLQGTVVTICYGEVVCPATEATGTRALAFSDVGGVSLNEDAAGRLEPEHVENMLMEAQRALTDLGVCHDDGKLDNFHLIGDRIVVIDFDSSDFLMEGADPEFAAKCGAKHTSHLYWLVHGGKMPSLI